MIDVRPCAVDLVTQTLDNNCASACLSMITRRDVGVITDVFHAAYVNDEINPHDYLDRIGIKYRRCMAAERSLSPDCVYIMAVPSLNTRGGGHYIVIDCVSMERGWYVLDPNDGRHDRVSYSKHIHEGETFEIENWSPHYEFKLVDLYDFWDKDNEQ